MKMIKGLEEKDNSEEEYVLAREEFKVPIDAPKIRYMKFLMHTTWGNTQAAFINEITLWGSTK